MCVWCVCGVVCARMCVCVCVACCLRSAASNCRLLSGVKIHSEEDAAKVSDTNSK